MIVHSNCDYMFRLIWVIVGSIPDCSQFSDLLNVTNFKFFFCEVKWSGCSCRMITYGVSSVPAPLILPPPTGNIPQYPFYRRLGGPQTRSVQFVRLDYKFSNISSVICVSVFDFFPLIEGRSGICSTVGSRIHLTIKPCIFSLSLLLL